MEEIIHNFLKSYSKNGDIKPNEYRMLSYLCYRFEETLEREYIISIRAIEGINMSYPTRLKALDGLAFVGMIKTEKKKRATLIRLNFIDQLFDEELNPTKNAMSYLPDGSSFEKVTIDSRGDIDAKTYKETLSILPETYKESLTRGDSIIKNLYNSTPEVLKNLYNSFSVVVKNLYNQNDTYKESLRQTGTLYKISIQWIFPFNPLGDNSLVSLRPKLYRQIRDFLARKGTIYNNKYIYLLDIIDVAGFGGQIFQTMLNIEKEETKQFSSKESKNKPFEITKETIEIVPDKLRYMEGFIKKYNEWLDYRKTQKNAPVGFYTAKEDFNMLRYSDDPIRDIGFSIRVGAKSIIKKEKEKTEEGNNDYLDFSIE